MMAQLSKNMPFNITVTLRDVCILTDEGKFHYTWVLN